MVILTTFCSRWYGKANSKKKSRARKKRAGPLLQYVGRSYVVPWLLKIAIQISTPVESIAGGRRMSTDLVLNGTQSNSGNNTISR